MLDENTALGRVEKINMAKKEQSQPFLNRFIVNVKASPTLVAASRARELKRLGRNVISFTVGEPDFDTPEHIKHAAAEAMAKGFTKYTAVDGIAQLKETIQAKLLNEQKLEYKPSEIIVTNGGKQALAACCAVLLNEEDEVVIPAPYWTSYPDIVALSGAKSVVIETSPEEGYLITPEDLLAAVTQKTKVIILNSPSNPTGAAYSAKQLRELADAFLTIPNHKEIIILSDEVYEYFTYGDFQHASILQVAPELHSNVVIVNSFSKSYSMTGWRVGYAAGPRWLIDPMSIHQSQFTTNVCSIAQYAAAAAYSDNAAFPKLMRDEFAKRHKMVIDAVKQIPGIELPIAPVGAFYGFLRIEDLIGKKDGEFTVRSAEDFAAYLLERFDVATVHGEAFGDPGAIRISYALSQDQLKLGLEKIAEAAKHLQ